jgi:hypothetical protein
MRPPRSQAGLGAHDPTGGKSETTIDVPIGDLRKGYAINGHKSAQES